MTDGGLILKRKVDESVIVDLRPWGLGLLEVTTMDIRPETCRQHYAADKRIRIHRKEVFEEIERSKARPAQEATE